MAIRIGELDLATRRPDDLDAQLVNATGCASHEIDAILAAGPDRVAAALRPFLDADALPGSALAEAIAADAGAIAAIRDLYAAGPAPAVLLMKGDTE